MAHAVRVVGFVRVLALERHAAFTLLVVALVAHASCVHLLVRVRASHLVFFFWRVIQFLFTLKLLLNILHTYFVFTLLLSINDV